MFEETNPSDFEIEEIEQILEPLFPDEKPTIKFHYHGTYNVYLVNGEFIFKFPSKFLPASQKITLVQNELKTLRELRKSISLPIPEPTFSETSQDTQYIGYRMIPGESLSPHFDRTSNEEKQLLARQIASFLNELHPLKINTATQQESQEFQIAYRKEWMLFYKRIRSYCFKQITNSQAYWVENLFNKFLKDDNNFMFEPVLIHGDFDTSNILVNPQTMEVTGIIDFEETRYYDPAYDLIFINEGTEYLSELLNNYKGHLDSRILDRILFLFGRQPLHYIHSGLEYNLENMIHYGLDALDGLIKNWETYSTIIREVSQTLEKQ
jgi:aminoglycoside 2''-phosphotransferase